MPEFFVKVSRKQDGIPADFRELTEGVLSFIINPKDGVEGAFILDFYGTLGAACREKEQILALFRAGMTGARLNLSHTTLVECDDLLKGQFWPAAAEHGIAARLIVDLQGPELRVGKLESPVLLEESKTVLLGEGGIPVPQVVVDSAGEGDQISLDDSALLLEVEGQQTKSLVCRVLRGGYLESRKSLTVLGVQTDAPTLTEEDRYNLSLAKQYGVTDVLQPFVRGREDIRVLRAALDELGLEHVRIMAKIENQQGLDRLEEIVEEADVICIARGDLGNNIPLWKLPSAQKKIARCCREKNRSFFVVTQMLWSMQERAVPTRAEVCDIYNAVLDGADALMLTGETAVGKYPAQAMDYLVKTALTAVEDMTLKRE